VGAYVNVASKELICTKLVQKAVCFVSVADRGLRPKSRLRKAKTPAKWLALSGSGTILPKKYCTLGLSFCQWKIVKIGRNSGVKVKALSGTPQNLVDGGIMEMKLPSSFFGYMRVS
jgi:hypothetical protein